MCESPALQCISSEENERLLLQLTPVTKHKFLGIVAEHSWSRLRSVTASIPMQVPEDLHFSSMDVRVYKGRWLMKVCVLLSLCLVNLQWFQFTIVSHTVVAYYDTSAELVNWTSLVFMLCYVLFTFPVTFVLDNRLVNLRVAMILCNSLLLLGSVVKTLSVTPPRFWVAFLGQFLVALAQVIVLNVPTTLAFEWFAAEEKTLGNEGIS